MASSHLAAPILSVARAGARGVTIETGLRLPAQPGQFVMVWLPRMDEKPFSLVSDDPVTLTVLEAGPCTARMQHLQVGERLYVRGPFGHGFSQAGARPLLIAGGCGAAPLVFLARRLAGAGRPVTVALGARRGTELILGERFQGAGAALIACTEDGSAGERGLVTQAAERLLAAGDYDRVYACGPGAMLEQVADLCRRHGVPGEISREAYMRCGIGVCGSCDRGEGLLVCRDGPVFPVR